MVRVKKMPDIPHLQQPSSTTPPIDIAPSRLKLMRRGPDRKSEFLRALKDEGTGELTTSSSPGTSGEVGRHTGHHGFSLDLY